MAGDPGPEWESLLYMAATGAVSLAIEWLRRKLPPERKAVRKVRMVRTSKVEEDA